MSTRLHHLRSTFASLKVDAFLVTFMPHVRYISGFSGSAGICLVTGRSAILVTDGRYAQQVKHEVDTRVWSVSITAGSLLEELKRRSMVRKGVRIGFDGNSLTYAQYRQFGTMFPGVKFLPKVDVIEPIAAVKDPGEIRKIRRAVEITDAVFTEILDLIKPGIREIDLSAEISYRQRKHGAEADAFESIVASGERSALPHGRASLRKLAKGDLITLDFGCVVEGYHSDMTRTLVLGRPKPLAKKIYAVVLEAQTRAIGAARAGMRTNELDAVARNYIGEKGFEKYFRHSLGHGIGLQIHEQPRISVLTKLELRPGHVVTIEPGIYIPRFGGVRIEDDVVITDGSCEVLNRSPKELFTL